MKSLHLNDYCLISIKGDGASQFLQGQITLDIKSVKSDQAALAAICNAKGRVISLFHIFQIGIDFYLLLPKSISQISIDYLKTYSVFYKVTLSQDSQDVHIIQSANQHTSQDQEGQATNDLQDSLSQRRVIPIQHSDFSLIIVPHKQHQSNNKANDKQFLWYWQLAAKKICWLTAESSGQFLPHNLNLPALKAVDFNKGCFTGQEIIARMQYKGKLKQQLALLQTQPNASQTSPLAENNRQILELAKSKSLFQQGKKVGEVVCHAHHPQQGDRFISLLKKPLNSLENFMLDAENPPILNLVE